MPQAAHNQGPIRITIDESAAGQPLANLVEQIVGVQAAAEVLAHGGTWLGRERIHDGERLLPLGETLTISRPPHGGYSTLMLDPNWLLFEDADLVALDKPAGSYVEATPWDSGGHLLAALTAFLTTRDGQAPVLHLAHRLDRDTSGVLLFSKNPLVNPALQAAFAGGGVQKRYLCRCAGAPSADSFELFSGHGRGAKGFFRVYPTEHIGQLLPTGGTIKPMRTQFRVLQRDNTTTLIEAQPITGRTHQIRLHLAAAGLPLLGDAKYGGPSEWNGQFLPFHLLHAAHLALAHPRTNQLLDLHAGKIGWAS